VRQWIESWPDRAFVVVTALLCGVIGLGIGAASDSSDAPSAAESDSGCTAAVVAGDELISALLATSEAEAAVRSDSSDLAVEVARLESAVDRISPAGNTWLLLRDRCLYPQLSPTTMTQESE
jgi:hypothetical protein